MLTITWQHRVAPNLQLVKTTVSAKRNKVQHNNVKYACISRIHRYKNKGSERRNHPPRITNGPSWDQREVFLVPVFPTVVCLPAFPHWHLWWVLNEQVSQLFSLKLVPACWCTTQLWVPLIFQLIWETRLCGQAWKVLYISSRAS